MPGIAFLPLALLIFNFSLETELAIIIYPALWPVMINTMGGVDRRGEAPARRRPHVSPDAHAGAVQGRSFRPPRPAILVGARLSLGVALVMAVIAEMLGNPQGLGYAIIREMQAFQPEKMFAAVLVVGHWASRSTPRCWPRAAGRFRGISGGRERHG